MHFRVARSTNIFVLLQRVHMVDAIADEKLVVVCESETRTGFRFSSLLSKFYEILSLEYVPVERLK